MLGHLSQKSKDCIGKAEQIAIVTRSNNMDLEHLLLGTILESDEARKYLKDLGFPLRIVPDELVVPELPVDSRQIVTFSAAFGLLISESARPGLDRPVQPATLLGLIPLENTAPGTIGGDLVQRVAKLAAAVSAVRAEDLEPSAAKAAAFSG